MPSLPVTVEAVTGGKAMVRFVELPHVLHGPDRRWAPPVMAWERYRLDPARNPYFDRGDAAYLLARRAGRPVGRVVAHVPEPRAEGRFGFWATDGDMEVARALVDAAVSWLAGQGCRSMRGPLSFAEHEEAGVLADGHDVPGTTGRPWHPPWEAELLTDATLEAVDDRPTWCLDPAALAGDRTVYAPEPIPGVAGQAGEPTADAVGPGGPTGDPVSGMPGAMPGQAGPYGDPRLVVAGAAAVPDLAPALRQASLRSAWTLARRARRREWTRCTVVETSGDVGLAVRRLAAAAHHAGYTELVAPWHPDPAPPPETVHRLFHLTW